MNKQNERIRKIRKRYGVNAFRKFGRLGGSPILLAHKLKHPVKGYRVTHQ